MLGLMTVAAVLIAPVCASLCAARVCEKVAPVATGHEKCHEMGMAKDHGVRMEENSLRPCGRGELPAAILSSPMSELRVAERRSVIVIAGLAERDAAASFGAVEFARPGSRGGGWEKLGESGVTLSVLRI